MEPVFGFSRCVLALNEHGKPIEVIPLILDTDEDKKRFHEGESRMMNRLREAGRIWEYDRSEQLPLYLLGVSLCNDMSFWQVAYASVSYRIY